MEILNRFINDRVYTVRMTVRYSLLYYGLLVIWIQGLPRMKKQSSKIAFYTNIKAYLTMYIKTLEQSCNALRSLGKTL